MNAPLDLANLARNAVDRADEQRREQNGSTSAGSPIWFDENDWCEADIPGRPWVAPGYALRGAVTLLAGPPSVMKSSLMLAWATALALGRPFGRFQPVEAAPAIIYNVEDDRTEQRRRLSAVLRQFDAVPADIRGKILRTGPLGVGTLIQRRDDGSVFETAALAKLEQLADTAGAAMLIVDPLAELHTVEENDNTGLRAVIAELRRVAVEKDIAIVVLHHSRKGAATMAGDPDIARGASAIIGAARMALTLTPMSEDDAKAFGLPTDHRARSSYIRLDDAKSNYSPIRDAAWFEKVIYALDNGEAVPAPVPWTPPAAKAASLEDLAALAAAIERGHPNGEPWSPKLSSEPRSVRALLEEFGFVGAGAQKAVIAKLEAEQGMVTAKFRSKQNRHKLSGLRIGALPQADWSADDSM